MRVDPPMSIRASNEKHFELQTSALGIEPGSGSIC